MASRHQRRKRALIKKAAIAAERVEAFIANERAKVVKANLARDNREQFTVRDHLGRLRVVKSRAYSKITDSFNRMVEGGGLVESLNLDRVEGDNDRAVAAFKAKHSKI